MRRADRPLQGRCALITRARKDGGELRTSLEAAGATVLELPTIEIVLPEDFAPLDEAIRQLSRYDWIAFTSRHAVEAVFGRMLTLGLSGWFPDMLRVAAIGPATASALRLHGVVPDCGPERGTSAALAEAMAQHGVKDTRVLLPMGDLARRELRDGLQRAGAHVDPVIAYRTVAPQTADRTALAALHAGQVDVVVVASPSALRNLASLVHDGAPGQSNPAVGMLRGAMLVCIGPTTAAVARELGIEPAVVAREPTVAGLVAATVELYTTENTGGKS